MTSCHSASNQTSPGEVKADGHKIEAKEIIQANAYTYVKALEDGNEYWIAVSKGDYTKGGTYYFSKGLEMKNFKSKDLDRTFESIYFVDGLSNEPLVSIDAAMTHENPHSKAPVVDKKEIKIEPAEGGITIQTLYENKKSYENKKVIIKGKVVKVNFEIMGLNWFHIQDGTADGDNYDLTVTTTYKDIEMDDIVNFEGTIALDKDFGAGYKYNVIMENAQVK